MANERGLKILLEKERGIKKSVEERILREEEENEKGDGEEEEEEKEKEEKWRKMVDAGYDNGGSLSVLARYPGVRVILETGWGTDSE
ncbi:hypothetical protein V1477_020769 [Vespula maculifrons]|uniref:Uncharacterized protein n=1 Tax=Vespula maculifrons TaxID=7453 RepID=A0ABD2AMU9_VESMC